MQIRDFHSAMVRVIERFELQRITDNLSPIIQAHPQGITTEVKNVFRDWIYLLVQLQPDSIDADEAEILQLYGLNWLLNRTPLLQFGATMLATGDWRTLRNSEFGERLATFVTLSRSLIFNENVVNRLLIRPKFDAVTASGLLILRIRENNGVGVELARFETIVSALNAIGRVFDNGAEPWEKTHVAFLDSGSDLAMGIHFRASIRGLTDFLRFAFDRIFYYRQNRQNVTVDMVLKSADGVAHINGLVSEQRLSPEEALQFKKAIRAGMKTFIENGVYPDDERDPAVLEQLVLPREQPQRLLTDGGPPTDGPVDGSAVDME